MKRIAVASLLIGCLFGSSLAQLTITRSVFGSGGITAVSDKYVHRATIGQCDAGGAQGSNIMLCGGFWIPMEHMSTVDVQENKGDATPRAFALTQNYPNPFNPSTSIRYELPSASQVKLTVYDVMGREVGILENDFKQAGRYNVVFNADNLASGVYLYRIQASNHVQAHKMIVVR